LRDAGVLVGSDGPFANVVKIRPPMVFSEADADLLLDAFERVLVAC
jgi:4-aminobutyrate aminotransferase-like enzyme